MSCSSTICSLSQKHIPQSSTVPCSPLNRCNEVQRSKEAQMNECVGHPLLCTWHEMLADTYLTTPPTITTAQPDSVLTGWILLSKSSSDAVITEELLDSSAVRACCLHRGRESNPLKLYVKQLLVYYWVTSPLISSLCNSFVFGIIHVTALHTVKCRCVILIRQRLKQHGKFTTELSH